MDNLAEAVKFGYITDKEAQLLELLDMPARDAKPPKGVPKTHMPKHKGKTGPKEKLKKLTPKQKSTLKAKTDGKVDKTKDGIDSFYMEGTGGATGIGNNSSANSRSSASSGSSYNGSGGGGRDSGADSPSGDSGRGTTGGSRGSQGSNGGRGTQNASRETQGNVSGSPSRGISTPNASGSPGNNPTRINVQPGDGSLRNSMTQRDAVRAMGANRPAAPQEPDRRSNVGVMDTPRLSADPARPAAPPAALALDDVMPPVTRAERAIGRARQPTSFARVDSSSSLDNLGHAGSMFESPMADRPGVYNGSELGDVVGGTTPARANPPTREAYAENVASDPNAGRINDSQASLASLTSPGRITDRIPDDNSAMVNNYAAYRPGVVPQASVEAARSAILGDEAQAAGTLTEPYDPAAPAVAAGTLTAPYNPIATAAGTPTAPYNPLATAAGTLTGPYNPAPPAVAAGTLTGPYEPARPAGNVTTIGRIDAAAATEAYDRANAIPGITPAVASGTMTTPYNVAAEPDSPLSPLATARPRALGLDDYQGPSSPAVAAGTLTQPYNTAANDNNSELSGLAGSTIADQNMPNTSTIADQNLPGGLPSAPSRGGASLGQGGQNAALPGSTLQPGTPPVAPPPVTPPAEQTDPYAGIMPWDRIAYDAIKASYENSGQTYTPAQFIASFYNQRRAA